MNKKKTKHKFHIQMPKCRYLIAAFAIPFLACMLFLVIREVYPFGNRCILQKDMYDQYTPFFYSFARMLKNREISLYDWNMGLGADFISTYSYYLSSPLNFLLFFVPENYVIEFMTYSIVLRIGLCGLNFYLFLSYRFDFSKLENANSEMRITALFLSTAYALSGYVAAYNWQIMWMDDIALAPLIFLGLLKMHKEKKPALYFISLALAIFSNFYIAMMICIFLVFYWFMILFEEENKAVKIRFSLNFVFFSLLAGGCSALTILPTASDLSNSFSDATSFPEKIEWFYSPLVALARGNAYSKAYDGAGFWPNIYAGVFTLLLVIVFILSKDIDRKRKIPRILMLLFFQLSFMNNVLSYLWHGFRQPTWFPARQSFLYIFMLLTIGMEGYLQIKNVRKKYLFVSFGVLIFLVFLSAFADDKEITGWYSFSVTGFLILAYAVLFLLYYFVEAETKSFLFRIIMCIAFGEVLLSMQAGSFNTLNRDTYTERIEQLQELISSGEEEGFYRTDMPGSLIRNDASLIGYSSMSVFNTILNKNVANYYDANLLGQGNKYYSSRGLTPIVAAMLGERYYIESSVPEGRSNTDPSLNENYSKAVRENENPLRKLVANVGDYYLYENNYFLPIAFTIPKELTYGTENPDKLNEIPLSLTGKKAYQQSLDFAQNDEEDYSELIIDADGYYYLQNINPLVEEMEILYPDGRESVFYSVNEGNLMEFGYLNKEDKLVIANPYEEEMLFNLYKADIDVIEESIHLLGRNTFSISKKTSSSLEGSITVEEGECVFFSIPADKGWKAYVDGEETLLETAYDAFICLSPGEGKHSIRLVYEPPYMKIGALISLICMGVGVSALAFVYFGQNFRQKVRH